jgi:hypothetical protein
VPTRWEITKAVRASDLTSPARLIMLVLADVAEVGTAEIPQQFTPSITVLERETALGRSTVQRYLNELDAAGWIVRTRPATPQAQWEGERVRYQLCLPSNVVVPLVDPVVPQEDEGSPVTDTGVIPERDRGDPAAGPLETDLFSDPDQIKNLKPSSPKPTKGDESEPPRADVEKICRHLADRIVDNGSRRPKITPTWRTEARLLLDKDGRTVEQVIKAIDWCQTDDFWRANVLSMPKLREKYDQLRLAAQRNGGARASPRDLVEHNGLRLKPETLANMQARQRFEAMDAANEQTAIEGPSP